VNADNVTVRCRSVVAVDCVDVQSCIPQYRVGHQTVLRQIAEYVELSKLSDQLTLTGASYSGVSVNDCIYHARQDVQRLAHTLNVTHN